MRISNFSIAAIVVALVTGATLASPSTADASTSTYAQQTVDADGRKVRVVRHRPPALRVEVRTRRPSRRHVWIDGHWRYRHARYVWVKGRWSPRPRHSAIYVRPHWVRRGGGWVQVGGFWRF
ncbi:MAG: BcpO-related WXXGXW repeat protein [Rhodothermales bacterium]|nr:BcpO-related WXXGXW repeat protein [Rhodothermales bacterium]